jgi:hypothetical protein
MPARWSTALAFCLCAVTTLTAQTISTLNKEPVDGELTVIAQHGLPDAEVFAFASSADGRIWAGARGAELYTSSDDGLTWQLAPEKWSAGRRHLTSVGGDIYVIRESKLFRIAPPLRTPLFNDYHYSYDGAENVGGKLYLTAETFMEDRRPGAGPTFDVMTVQADGQLGVWAVAPKPVVAVFAAGGELITAGAGGLLRHPNSRHATVLVDGAISAAAATADGTIVYGAADGVYAYRNGQRSRLTSEPSALRTILVTKKGSIYAGAENGIYEIDARLQSVRRAGFAHRPIDALHETAAGTILASTDKAIYRSADGAKTWTPSWNGFERQDIETFAMTGDHVIARVGRERASARTYLSVDRGISWQPAPAPTPDAPLWTLKQVGDDAIAVSDEKLYRWDTARHEWKYAGAGLENSEFQRPTFASDGDHVWVGWISRSHGAGYAVADRRNWTWRRLKYGHQLDPSRSFIPAAIAVVTEDSEWSNLSASIGQLPITALRATPRALYFATRTTIYQLDRPWQNTVWTRWRLNGMVGDITDLWVDPDHEPFAVITTSTGVFWTTDGDTLRKAVTTGEKDLRPRQLVRVKNGFVVGGTGGLAVVADRVVREGFVASAYGRATKLRQHYARNWWYRPAEAVFGAVIAYLTAIGALLFATWERGSALLGRSRILRVATKPLVVVPALGRWALFLGYDRRLRARLASRLTGTYFGLPAVVGDDLIAPDADGRALHAAIATAAGPQKPVMLEGDGGAGKSTVLSRLADLACRGQLPAPLGKLRAVLLHASAYEGDLVDALVRTLADDLRVAINRQMAVAQMELGGLLILFDGVSEIDGDKSGAVREIVATAQNAAFRRCRFIIATRPIVETPDDVSRFTLRPLHRDAIALLLSRFGITKAQEARVRRQLAAFGSAAIDPLLLRMAIAHSDSSDIRGNRNSLYEAYFRRLLRVEERGKDLLWDGWKRCLDLMSYWFVLQTGRRGRGLPHEELTDRLLGRDSTVSVMERLREDYGLAFTTARELLIYLQTSGILEKRGRWRFAHDTFEEYFAASFLAATVDSDRRPTLFVWRGEEAKRDLGGILEFLSEMDASEAVELITNETPAVDALTPEVSPFPTRSSRPAT